MSLKILGISGSPVEKGNTGTFLRAMIESVKDKGADSEILDLASLVVADCIHCNFCLTKQKPGKYCALKDDAQIVFDKAETSDIIILSSPVYFMRTSGRMAALIDRLRVFVHGNVAGGALRNKIGVSAAVGWLRNGGIETTHLSHIYAFLTLEMIPASVGSGLSPLGASGLASEHGSGTFDRAVRLGVEQDERGLESGRLLMERAYELAGKMKK